MKSFLQNRNAIGFILSMVAYSVLLWTCLLLAEQQFAESPVRYGLVLIPVLPLVAALYFIIGITRTEDELKRRINVEALTLSYLLTMFATFSLGMLETVGLPHLPLFMIAPFMIGSWGIITGIVTKRYQ